MRELIAEQTAESGTIGRRTLLKVAVLGAAGLAFTPALAGCSTVGATSSRSSKTLKVVTTTQFPFGKLNAMKTLSKEDATALGVGSLTLFKMLQAWKKKNPGITLEFQEIEPLAATQKALLAAQAGNPADVIWDNDLNIPQLASGGYLTDLADLPGDWNDYNQKLTALTSIDGSQFALPFTTDARMTVYNKVAFSNAGITDMPATWDEFNTALAALKGAGKGGYGYWAGPFIHTPTMTILSTLWMLGGSVVDSAGKVNLSTDEMRKTFEYYNSLMNVNNYTPSSLLNVSDQDEYVKTLTDGDVSCQFDGSWVLGQFDDAGIGDQYGVFRTPRPSASSADSTLSGFWAMMLPKQKKVDKARTEIAFDFAMNFCGSKGQSTYIADTVTLPTRKSVLEDKAIADSKSDQWKFVAQYSVEAGRPMPNTTDNALLFDSIQTAFQSYLSGKASVQDALAGGQQQFDSGKK